jgi:hypothetical protein
MVHRRRQGHDLGPMPRGEPVPVHRQDGPAAEHGDTDLDAGLVGPLGRPGWRRQGRRREGGVHAELLGELVRLSRLRRGPDLLHAGDVRPEGVERRQDPTAALTPGVTKAPPQVPGHHPQVGLVGRGHQRTSSSVASRS